MITRYVNTDSTAGGDGTTNATAGANRAFATLREALNSLPGALTDATTIFCSGSIADTLNCTQSVWDFDTTSVNRLRIVGDNVTGKWNTNAYRMEITNAHCIYNNDASHVSIENLQIKLTLTTNGSTNHNLYRLATANNLNQPVDHVFKNCIAWMVVTGTNNAHGFSDSDPGGGGTCRRINCIAYGGTAGFQSDSSTWARDNLGNYNCTAHDNEGNYVDLQICVNCIGSAPSLGAGFSWIATGTTGHSNNASTDTTAGGTNARDNQTFSFVDAANGDFHLQAGDGGAKDFGLSDPLSGAYLDDIDGQTRSGSWDIGADEYVAPDTALTVGFIGEPVVGGSTF